MFVRRGPGRAGIFDFSRADGRLEVERLLPLRFISLTDKFVVLVTCSSAAQARRIAHAVVEARLAACVNILPGAVTSIYRWKGKVESARERLLLIKTSRKRLAKLRAAVERIHSYDVPEFVALPIADGSPAYLRWIQECLQKLFPLVLRHR
jgi:periplasmic divalent cation tolerance protein